MDLKTKKTVLLSSASFVLLTAVLVGGFLYLNNQKEVIATVNGKKITLSNYKERAFAVNNTGTVEKTVGVDKYNKSSILTGLVKSQYLAQEFEKKGYSKFGTEEINKKAKTLNTGFDTLGKSEKEAVRKLAESSLIEEKMKSELVTYRAGKFLLCRYDRYTQDDMLADAAKAQALKDTQKKYAEEYCKGIQERLAGGASTYEQEKTNLLADAVIGNESWRPFFMTLASEFNKDNFSSQSFVVGSNLKEKILEIKNQKISDSTPIKVSKGSSLTEVVDGAYAVILVDDFGNNGETTSFEEYLDSKIKELSAKKEIQIYEERIKL